MPSTHFQFFAQFSSKTFKQNGSKRSHPEGRLSVNWISFTLFRTWRNLVKKLSGVDIWERNAILAKDLKVIVKSLFRDWLRAWRGLFKLCGDLHQCTCDRNIGKAFGNFFCQCARLSKNGSAKVAAVMIPGDAKLSSCDFDNGCFIPKLSATVNFNFVGSDTTKTLPLILWFSVASSDCCSWQHIPQTVTNQAFQNTLH